MAKPLLAWDFLHVKSHNTRESQSYTATHIMDPRMDGNGTCMIVSFCLVPELPIVGSQIMIPLGQTLARL